MEITIVSVWTQHYPYLGICAHCHANQPCKSVKCFVQGIPEVRLIFGRERVADSEGNPYTRNAYLTLTLCKRCLYAGLKQRLITAYVEPQHIDSKGLPKSAPEIRRDIARQGDTNIGRAKPRYRADNNADSWFNGSLRWQQTPPRKRR